MKVLLYRDTDWRTGKPALSEHQTREQANLEAIRLTREQFGDKPTLSIGCLANCNYVIAYQPSEHSI